MKLEDFVAETLKEVLMGVATAQEFAAERGGKIVPERMSYQQAAPGQIWDYEDGMPITLIDFDVAVTTTEGTATKGGIGVFVGPLALGSQGQSEGSNQSVSRIKFGVPLRFPSQPGSST